MLVAAKAFFQAVMWGTFTGALPFLFFTIPMSFMAWEEGALGMLSIATAPLFITLAVVLPAMVCIGVPITAVLMKFKKESPSRYAYLGAASGFFLPIGAISLYLNNTPEPFLMLGASLMFSVLGMVSGFASGLTWGNWRMRLAQAKQ